MTEIVTKTETAAETPAKVEEAPKVEAVKATTPAPLAKEEKSEAGKAKPVAKKVAAKVTKAKRTIAKKAAPKVKTIKKAVRKVAKKAAPATGGKEMKMFNFDSKQWFAGVEVPGTEKFEAMLAEANEKGQAFAKKSQEAGEELVALTKANIEAMVEAGKIATSGAKQIGSELVENGRDGIEKVSETVKALAEAKSPTEFFQLQSEWLRASFDNAVAEGSKLTEQVIKLSGDAMKPVQNRASVSVEKMKSLIA